MLAAMLSPAPSTGLPHPARRRGDMPAPAVLRSRPLPVRPNPAAPLPGRGTIEAAEALLYTLALPHAGDAEALVTVARELRAPLAAVVGAGSPREAGAEAQLLAVVDGLLDAASVESGTLLPALAAIAPAALVTAVATALAGIGLRCGRRIILQPGAPVVVTVDTPRLTAAVEMLAILGLRHCQGPARVEVALDADAEGIRLDLGVLPKFSLTMEAEDECRPATELPVVVARRLIALQGGRLDAWTLPAGGFRARLRLGGG